MEIEVEMIELVNNKNGECLKRWKEIREFPELGKREPDICGICGATMYPECKSFCSNMKLPNAKLDLPSRD